MIGPKTREAYSGSTDEVVEEIMSSWPQDAWDLRAYLLSKSPFLSQESLEQMVQQAIMPDAMVTEILVANPEATQAEGFLNWLQEESGHPLPPSLLALVVASWDERTYRSSLESTMAFHHGEMTQAAHYLMDHYAADTTYEHVDSLRLVWQEVRTLAGRYAEALTYVQEGNFTAAIDVVSHLPIEHNMELPEAQERVRMLDVLDLLKTAVEDDRDESRLDSAEVAELETLAAGAYDRPANWASNILCFYYDKCRSPLTGGGGHAPMMPLPWAGLEATSITEPSLSLQPNPAAAWVAAKYVLDHDPGEAWICVRDVNGKEQLRSKIVQREEQVVFDLRALAPGAYTVVLSDEGVLSLTDKLIVQP
ncbi:MAG: hypothetical protein IPG10_02415 [Flavobacteriales bacterium]|jgi:hypothetical protein|nr:hypothetical protein [Flavobacteriales bacterium]MBK6753834.1 hypothetical protein [Flavobacteriales bacterium]MBK9074013.1 hypothetical protein [Flavobacteriales bacterium]